MESAIIRGRLKERMKDIINKYEPLEVVEAVIFRMKLMNNDWHHENEIKKIMIKRELLRIENSENWEEKAMTYAIKIYNSFSTGKYETLENEYKNYLRSNYLEKFLR